MQIKYGEMLDSLMNIKINPARSKTVAEWEKDKEGQEGQIQRVQREGRVSHNVASHTLISACMFFLFF